MSTDIVEAAVETFITNNWTGCAIQWPNRNYEPSPNTPWARVEFIGSAYEQQSIGSGSPATEYWTEQGVIWFHVNVPIGTGEVIAAGLCRQLAELFKLGNPLNTIEFQQMNIGSGSPAENQGPWWEKGLSIVYVRR